jgi:hypothetical protein
MVAFPWDSAANEDEFPDLPEPDVEFMTGDQRPDHWTGAGVKGIVMNPVYAGVGGFPPYVSDKQWVAACKRVMEQDSPEQFLVNLLFVLRKTFGDGGTDGE